MLKVLFAYYKNQKWGTLPVVTGEYNHFYGTLQRMPGIKALFFPYEKMQENGREKANYELLGILKHQKIDLFFAAMANDELVPEILKEIAKNTKTLTLAYFGDDQWRFHNYSRYWAPYFNWVTTTDSQAPAEYYKIGCRNVIKTQYGCNQHIYKPSNLPKIYDVTFIGQNYGDRGRIIEEIKKVGINIQCWGSGWPNGQIPLKKMIKIFSQSKINLNFTKVSTTLSLKAIAKIFFQRKYNRIGLHKPQDIPLNFLQTISPREQIKSRTFEVPACGGFLLSGYAENLQDYYKIDKEIVCFSNIKDLIEKIKYYLTHEEEREKIAKKGYERTVSDHTYEKRFTEIFKTIGLS